MCGSWPAAHLVATANDAWTQFDLDLSEDVVNLGTTTELSLEKLLAADPDFVIASANTQIDLDWMETLEDAGIPTAYFDVNDFQEYPEHAGTLHPPSPAGRISTGRTVWMCRTRLTGLLHGPTAVRPRCCTCAPLR